MDRACLNQTAVRFGDTAHMHRFLTNSPQPAPLIPFASDHAWPMISSGVASALQETTPAGRPFPFQEAVTKGRTLLVGEGNFSFTEALVRLVPQSSRMMTSTCWEPWNEIPPVTADRMQRLARAGLRVAAGVDARSLELQYRLFEFDLISFLFPNTGTRGGSGNKTDNHQLASAFLASAKRCLQRTGLVVITLVDSAHWRGAFDIEGAAARTGMQLLGQMPFFPSQFPGYEHSNTIGGPSALRGYDDFVSLSLRPGDSFGHW